MESSVQSNISDYVSTEIEKALSFARPKYGDTPTDAIQLTPKKYVDGQVSILNASIVGIQTSIASFSNTTFPNLFGDGSDGALILTTSSIMSRDMYYTTVQISSTASLNVGGYQLFVSSVLAIDSGCSVQWNGNTGGNGGSTNNGTGGVGGTGGVALTPGTTGIPTAGTDGGAGGNGGTNINGQTPAIGPQAASVATSIGVKGVSGAHNLIAIGGASNAHTGGNGASSTLAGSWTPALILPSSSQGAFTHVDTITYYVSHYSSGPGGSSGGGGGGAGGTPGGTGGGGGGGGGTGSSGGIVAIYSKHITNNALRGIQALGGTGGNGGNGGNGLGSAGNEGGGGGGGAGGNGGTGGAVIVAYHSSVQNGTYSSAGGSHGTAGIGGTHTGTNSNDGVSGNAGSDGSTGKIWLYQI